MFGLGSSLSVKSCTVVTSDVLHVANCSTGSMLLLLAGLH